MSYKLTYTLRQQSPIIHFQPDQAGATLRATEVKPKLDRFLIRICGGKENVNGGWFIGDTEALNYKISFTAGTPTREVLGSQSDNKQYDIYYGNMGNGPSKEGLTSTDIKMTIVSFIPQLLDLIDQNIGDFFIVHNFGTMQDKGFGSYIVDDKGNSQAHISQTLKQYYNARDCYCFDAGDMPFKRIKTLYAIIKSGINDNRGYQRSLLFLYMHNRYHYVNEKAMLKRWHLAPIIGTHQHDMGRDNEEPHYVRALLGVGDTLRFKKDGGGYQPVSIRCNAIQRLSSPILFKIINGKIYYVGKRINRAIYGKRFIFAGRKELTVPTREQLTDGFIDDFLEFCYNAFNNSLDYNAIGQNVSQNILQRFGDDFTVRRI